MRKSLPLFGISLALTLTPYLANAADTAVQTTIEAPTLWDEISKSLPPNTTLRNDGLKTEKTAGGTVTEIKNPHFTWRDGENLQAIPTFEAYLDGVLTIKSTEDKHSYSSSGVYHFLVAHSKATKPTHFTLSGELSNESVIDLSRFQPGLSEKQLVIAFLKSFKSDHATLKNVIFSLLTPEPKILTSIEQGSYSYENKPHEKEMQELNFSCKSTSDFVYHSAFSNFDLSHYQFISFFLPEIGKIKNDTDAKVIMPSWDRVVREAAVLYFHFPQYLYELKSLPSFSTTLTSHTSCKLLEGACDFKAVIKEPENKRQEVTLHMDSNYHAVASVIEETKASFIKQFDAAVSQQNKSDTTGTENTVKQIDEFDQIIYNCVKSEAFAKLIKLLPLELSKEFNLKFSFSPEPRLLSDWKYHFDLSLLTPKNVGLKIVGDGDTQAFAHINLDILDKQLVLESTVAGINTFQELLKSLGFVSEIMTISKEQTQEILSLLESVTDESSKQSNDLHIKINVESEKPSTVGNKPLMAFAAELFAILNKSQK